MTSHKLESLEDLKNLTSQLIDSIDEYIDKHILDLDILQSLKNLKELELELSHPKLKE